MSPQREKKIESTNFLKADNSSILSAMGHVSFAIDGVKWASDFMTHFSSFLQKQAMMALQEMAVLNGFNVASWC